jgi:hypothetical protein
MFSTGDLNPQASGTASIGVRQTGFDGQKMPPLPYSHVHMNSGVWHDALLGQSGIIRFAQNDDRSFMDENNFHQVAGRQSGFEISVDGGIVFPLLLGATHTIASGQGGGESFMANFGGGESFGDEGGGFEAFHIDEPGEPHQVAVIRGLDGMRHDMYIYASGINTIVGSKQLRLLGFGGGDSTDENDVDIHSAHDFRASSITDTTLRTSVGHIFLTPGLASQEGDVIAFVADSNSWLHFRQYGVGGFFGGVSSHQAWHVKNGPGIDTSGPVGNGEWPIAHSGQVAAMIAAAGGTSTDLQLAYDNGNEIDHRKDLIGYKGVVIRETIPGLGASFTSSADVTANKPGKYGIAVSGFTLTPNTPNSYALACLNSNALTIASSGSVSVLSRSMFMGYVTSDPSTLLVASDGDYRLLIGDQTGRGTGGQILLDPFAGSGRMQYRFGPHQAWAEKMTHASTGGPANDGFWPIPHSGMILEMIARTPKSKAITIERPAVNQDLTIWYTNEAIVVTEVESVLRGGFDASGQFSIRYGSDRTQVGTELTTLPITCTNRTTGQITTSFAAPNIPADNWVWIGVSGVSGVSTSQLNVTLQFQ